MIATTIEQSKQLLKLGVSRKTADMCWFSDMLFSFPPKSNEDVPSWSLSALIGLLPLHIGSWLIQGNGEKWITHYATEGKLVISKESETIFDAVYSTIIHTLKNR